jgi:ABC-type phosphate/phosphonate transport system substrate-binding protein
MNPMTTMARTVTALALALVLAGPAAAGTTPAGAASAAPLRIGMVKTIFRDVPEPLVRALMQPFAALLQAQTGRGGELVNAGDGDHLARMLTEGKVDIGVFHGIEFAWAQQKYSGLRPLVIAVNQEDHLRAFLMVRQDSPIRKCDDLKGKRLALPYFTREHGYVFLERRCPKPEQFFAEISRPANGEVGLDDLVDGKVDAVVTDGVCLERFKDRKPGRVSRLRVLEQSEVFPATVIAYHAGALDDATVQRFRQGLVGAKNTPLGRQLLTLWQLTAFQPVPADYEQIASNIVKAYPPPER